MAELMLALGDYRFSVDTAAYETLTRTDIFKWMEQFRLESGASQQYMGQGSTSIRLDGTIFLHYKGGLGQVERMREQAKKGVPLILVDGLGHVWGKYCIIEIEEVKSRLMANGAPRKIDFSIRLVSYGGE